MPDILVTGFWLLLDGTGSDFICGGDCDRGVGFLDSAPLRVVLPIPRVEADLALAWTVGAAEVAGGT